MPWISKKPDLKNDPRYLEGKVNDTIALLAEAAKKADLIATNNAVTLKSDKTYVDQKFSFIGSATPKGAYATLSALQGAYPSGNSNIYVVQADGKWYYWNGSAWTAGGVYQSTGLGLQSITPYNTDFISPYNINLFDKKKARIGGFYNSSSLAWEDYIGINQADFIPVVPGDVIRTNGSNAGGYHVVFKNSTGVIFAGQFKTPVNNMVTITVPANAVSVSIQVYNSVMDTFMITKNMELPTFYIPYKETGNLKKEIKVTKENFDPTIKNVDDYIIDEGLFINLFDKLKIRKNGFYHSTTLALENSEFISSSEFIPVKAGDTVLTNGTNSGGYHIVFKNSQGTIFKGQFKTPVNGVVTITVPVDAVSMSTMVYNSAIDSFMLVKNREMPSVYTPYADSVKIAPILSKAIEQIVETKIQTPAQPEFVLDKYKADRLLVWEETFDGTELDTTNWTYLKRADGSGNGQLEYNTDRSKNIRVADGKLIITAIKENYNGRQWTSGSINTDNLREFQYGRIEAKMKLPKGQGLWPAFWTLGAASNRFADEDGNSVNTGLLWPACGEIDILEYVNNNNFYSSTLHYDNGSGHQSAGNYNSPTVDVSQYNVYGMEWTENEIKFLVNDTVYGTVDINQATVNGENPFRKPHYLLLNLAVGGGMPGSPDATTPSKASMYVDWVRVYAPVGVSTYVNADSIALNKTSLAMTVGESKTPLVAAISPINVSEKTVKWSSSNPNVAIVGSGYVTAIGKGSCTITAKTINGKSAACQVTVS